VRVEAELLLLQMGLHVDYGLEAIKCFLGAVSHHALSLIEVVLNFVVAVVTTLGRGTPVITITIVPLLIVFSFRHLSAI